MGHVPADGTPMAIISSEVSPAMQAHTSAVQARKATASNVHGQLADAIATRHSEASSTTGHVLAVDTQAQSA